ncbi:MAG: OmpA family protein [Crocinitomicaceae bacterium]|nr:OmpA family protein [Crocinitomicaceae bacterium]
MRLLIIFLLFNTAFFVRAQTEDYNKWSLEGAIGFNNAVGPYAEGYSSNFITFLHADLGVRYMATNKFGAKLDIGFDRITEDNWGGTNGPNQNVPSYDFETHYFRISLQAVLNVGRVFEFEKLNENFGTLLHLGFGFSSLKNQQNSVWFKDWRTQGTDEMMNFIVGITPQYRIHDDWSIYVDLTMVANAWQSKTWDFTEENFDKGLHAKLYTFSIGAAYYFGKKEKHLDWVYGLAPLEASVDSTPRPDTIRTIRTIETIETIETIQVTGDEQASVQLPDEDNDGIPDSEDKCPSIFGKGENGCPNHDSDGDGVPDSVDDCPDKRGVLENDGCPELDLYVKRAINNVLISVEFEQGGDVLLDESLEALDKMVKVLNEYSEFKLDIGGHTNNSGHTEPNMVLSQARADRVLEYFINKGISADRLQALGHGDTLPIAGNSDPAGRKQNERIELKVRY